MPGFGRMPGRMCEVGCVSWELGKELGEGDGVFTSLGMFFA